MANINALKTSLFACLDGTTATAFTKEACTLDATRKKASIAAAAKRFWDVGAGIHVYVGTTAGTAVEVTVGFYVVYAGGHIVFASDVGAGANVYVSGEYLSFAAINECQKYSISSNWDTKDVTPIGSTEDGWKKKKGLLRESAITLSGFLDKSALNYLDSAAIDTLCFIEISYAGIFEYHAMGYLAANNIGGSFDDMITNERTVNSSGPVWYSKI